MILNRKIELEANEINEMEKILTLSSHEVTVKNKLNLLGWFTAKIQEAFDFGFAEGKKEKVKSKIINVV